MGSTGDPPVPPGHWPDGMRKDAPGTDDFRLATRPRSNSRAGRIDFLSYSYSYSFSYSYSYSYSFSLSLMPGLRKSMSMSMRSAVGRRYSLNSPAVSRPHFTFPLSHFPAFLHLTILILLTLTSRPLCAAEKKAAAKKPKPEPILSAKSGADKSVEALAQAARASVVVISHFGRDGKEDGIGAGFVVSSNGLIATSLHVIGEARPISVQLASGARYQATEIYAWDRKLDLAVIRIAAEKLPALTLGDSDHLQQGAPDRK